MTRVHVFAGTRKGAWIYTSDARRERWEISEPQLKGWQFFHIVPDTRRDPVRLYAAANHWAWGPSVAKSDDMGQTWDWVSEGLGFPEDMGKAIANVWCICPGAASQPGLVYAGTQPAGFFRSDDWGKSWRPVDGLMRSKWAQYWSGTGGGDSTFHSLVIDPADPLHMYASVSAGGSFVTHDGGETWDIFSNRAIPTNPEGRKMVEGFIAQGFVAPLPPDTDPLAIDEFHCMVIDHKDPQRLWTQTHVGVFRSDDAGQSWHDVTVGLPSFHSFPIAVTRTKPDAAYVVPVEFGPDNFRATPGQFTVWRTEDSGKSWEPLTDGLPGPNDYQMVYREGMDTDGLELEGVYVGTSNGALYASNDRGEHWQRLPGTLPPILSVTTLVTG